MTTAQLIALYLDMITTLEKHQNPNKQNPNTHALIVSFKFRVKELQEEQEQ